MINRRTMRDRWRCPNCSREIHQQIEIVQYDVEKFVPKCLRCGLTGKDPTKRGGFFITHEEFLKREKEKERNKATIKMIDFFGREVKAGDEVIVILSANFAMGTVTKITNRLMKITVEGKHDRQFYRGSKGVILRSKDENKSI